MAFGLLLLAGPGHAGESRNAEFKALYESHEWFKLRDAAQRRPDAPTLYRAAVAAAFNDPPACEVLLLQFLASAPPAADALEAHHILIDVYWRGGRFREALAQLEELIKLGGEGVDPGNFRAMFRALAQHPAMVIIRQQASSIRVWRKDGFVPLRLNGKPMQGELDTGANNSLISEKAARTLGLTVSEVRGETHGGDSTGNGVTIQKVAVADRLLLGGIELQHVPFIVLSDSALFWRRWSPDKRCVLGIQVLLACRTVRWKNDLLGARIEIGTPPGPRVISDSNLTFDGKDPHVAADFENRTLDLFLDTGADRTELAPRFASEFPMVTGTGKTKTWYRIGAGGYVKVELKVLPKVTLSLGGMDLAFKQMHVYPPGAKDAPLYHGTLGRDFVKVAREVTIDFEAMQFKLQ